MREKKLIICVFCRGVGVNPYYKGTCPVCKGRGKNQMSELCIKCPDCKGTGRKSGTTLFCYYCSGLGVIPDTQEEIKKARREIVRIQEEMGKEKQELYQKINKTSETRKTMVKKENFKNVYFCQNCGKEKPQEAVYKVCEKCFFLI